MKFTTKEEIQFAIEVMKITRDKIPEDSYAKRKVTVTCNHIIFELEDLIKHD